MQPDGAGTDGQVRPVHSHSLSARKRGRVLTIAAAVATAGLIAASIVVTARLRTDTSCVGDARVLTVVAAPEIVPAVTAAARSLPGHGGTCVEVSLAGQVPADSAAALVAGKAHPDVWIPDSSIWARGVAAAGLTMPPRNPSVAASPVVLAISPALAGRLGWPGRKLDLAQLLGSGTGSGQPVRFGLPDPGRWAASVGAVLAMRDTASARPDGRARLASVVRAALTELPTDPSALLNALAGDSPLAVPVSEQSVSARNRPDAVTAVAVHPKGATMTLDYPFVVLADASPAQAAAARLLTALGSTAAREQLRADGFRTDAAPSTVSVPDQAAVDEAIRTLRLLHLGSRLLAVVDISGSMSEAVAGAGNKTRLDLTKEAAALGLALYPDDAQIGLWVFSTELTPDADYKELVSVGPLGVRGDGRTGRELLVRSLGGISHIPGGHTGLYDTTLAAVRAARKGWDPARVNSVILLTDGRNDDPRSVTLPRLLSTLRAENDPARPVPVITIAYGPDSDAGALRAISRATGGEVYLAKDPRQIADVFRDAIGRRSCMPRC
jgi:Ca-activated chloride channel homolog